MPTTYIFARARGVRQCDDCVAPRVVPVRSSDVSFRLRLRRIFMFPLCLSSLSSCPGMNSASSTLNEYLSFSQAPTALSPLGHSMFYTAIPNLVAWADSAVGLLFSLAL